MTKKPQKTLSESEIFEEEKHKVCIAPNKFGGRFFRFIGEALARPYPYHARKIKNHFSDEWEEYFAFLALRGVNITDRYLIIPASITCFKCEKQSFSINDVKERFCGHCNKYHDRGVSADD